MLSVANAVRFWDMVPEKEPGTCWLWRGTVAWNGYGKFNAGGRRHTASRLALEIKLQRDLEPHELACHTCDCPPCVNPDHLFVGSEADNRADCLAKGRAHIPDRRGSKNARAKLTDEQVAQIRALKGGQRQQETAAAFGVSRQTVSAIQNGDRWSVSGGGAHSAIAQPSSSQSLSNGDE